jgi:hypothetical protein
MRWKDLSFVRILLGNKTKEEVKDKPKPTAAVLREVYSLLPLSFFCLCAFAAFPRWSAR